MKSNRREEGMLRRLEREEINTREHEFDFKEKNDKDDNIHLCHHPLLCFRMRLSCPPPEVSWSQCILYSLVIK